MEAPGRIGWAFTVVCVAAAVAGGTAHLTRASIFAVFDPQAALTACPGSDQLSTPAVEALEMHCLVNWLRVAEGRRPLGISQMLVRSSAMKARAIVRCGVFSHTPCGQPFWAVFARVGYFKDKATIGENLGWGEDALGAPLVILEEWMASPRHRANLRRSLWRDSGIAVVQEPALFGASDVSLWVMQFGRRSG